MEFAKLEKDGKGVQVLRTAEIKLGAGGGQNALSNSGRSDKLAWLSGRM